MGTVAKKKGVHLDWDDLRVFLAIAQNKSLTLAARTLRVTQPTAGRRLSRLEAKVGALFERTSRGLVVNDLGRHILEEVERMGGAADAVERRIASRDEDLRGIVRVTCLEWFATNVMASICARFTRQHPEVTVELTGDVRRYSLGKREADVAVRFARFEQLDVVQKKLGTLACELYASPEYLATFGAPDFDTELAGHAVLMIHEEASHLPEYRWFREIGARARVALRSNSSDTMARAAEAGAGLAVLPRYLGDVSTRLVRIATPTPCPARPIWLGVHKDLKHVPRIRAFVEHATSEIVRATRRS